VVGTVAAVLGTATTTFGSDSTGKLRLLQTTTNDDTSAAEDLKAFQSYIQRHNKNYLTKEEHQARLNVFAANLALVKSHNSVSTGFKIGINQFADMSPEEYHKMLGFRGEANTDKFLDHDEIFDDDEDSVPTVPAGGNATESKGRGLQSYARSIDWRQQGVMNAVRNQGTCGGCYAFSAANAIEAAYKIKFGSLP
jgi:xylem cysteine proteinase